MSTIHDKPNKLTSCFDRASNFLLFLIIFPLNGTPAGLILSLETLYINFPFFDKHLHHNKDNSLSHNLGKFEYIFFIIIKII